MSMRRAKPLILTLALLVSGLPGLAAGAQRVVFLVGEQEYGSERSLPEFAKELELSLSEPVVVRLGEGAAMPTPPRVEEADLLLLFLRFREPSAEQRARLEAWIDAGKPAVALRTTSHLFWGEELRGWFPPRFGGHYKGHADNGAGTRVALAASALEHPALRGMPRVFEAGYGGTYDAQPLSDGAQVLLFGRTGELPAQPVAWTYATRAGQRLVYTSLGTEENFEEPAFRLFLANACLWALGHELPPAGAPGFGGRPRSQGPDPSPAPAPPASTAPRDAELLFDGDSLERWRHWDPSGDPPAIEVDERADTSAGGPAYAFPRWTVQGGSLVARPGFGDLVTLERFASYHLHLDFLVPEEDRGQAPGFGGEGGVYVAGRWEVALSDSAGRPLDERSAGAVNGHEPPALDAAGRVNEWQSLDLTSEDRPGEPPRLSVWLNGERVQDDVELLERTPYGFLAPMAGMPGAELDDAGARFVADEEGSLECDWGVDSFGVGARFRAGGDGTLVSKCRVDGDWSPEAKALFLRGGRLVYDIGWVGAVETEERYDDGEWHRVVLTSDEGHVRIWVDGELAAEEEDFAAEDEDDFVFKVGAANHDFGGRFEGLLSEVAFWSEGLSEGQARRLSDEDDWADPEPAYEWQPGEEELEDRGPEPGAGAPIRLQADSSRLRFANIWVRPLGEVDHAGLIEGWGEESYRRGQELYAGTCLACHGPDGMRPTNPQARPFAVGVFENGSDPLALYKTIRFGYEEMPANLWLEPRDTYALVHYLRERFLRRSNPSQHVAVDAEYLAGLPRGRRHGPATGEADARTPRDFGPALGAQLGDEVGAGLAVRLDERTTLGYDLQTMSSPGAWEGDLLALEDTHHYQQRGEAIARPGGELMPGLDGWGWGHGGSMDWDRDRRPRRGPLPVDWLDYRGYHVDAEGLVLRYRIDGREVLERPGVDRAAGIAVITHRMYVGAGEAELLLRLARAPGGRAGQLVESRQGSADGYLPYRLLAAGLPGEERLEPFCVVASLGGDWPLERDAAGDILLRIPASQEGVELYLLRYGSPFGDELEAFERLLANRREGALPASPREDLGGAELRWPEVLTTRGVLGREEGAYAVDTLSLPPENPWNAWLRTSALDFFPDGRAALTTYGGDVWIVSGIDEGLEELRWKRFAAGLFEPMGALVVDGKVLVTCRDRIVRLHDQDGNGEADFYESFFPDTDTTASFHSFAFDLQTDAEGNLYYAKSGQYSDYALPGAILKIAPDGRSHEVYSTGLRTPNGMGMSPDGRPLVSDNQGNWVPASKVSIARPGAFHGVFKSINTNGAGVQTREDFDQPVIWMPQRLDSSSGGQLWVQDARFGPLAGRYLHTSFGKGWMYPLVVERVGDIEQGAIWRMPFQFAAGIQRLRVNPADGQVYTVGLSGWQGPGSGADGCLQRVRFTGREETLLVAARATRAGVELEFSGPLDESSLSRDAFSALRWNYRWARQYGSAHWSVKHEGREGEDALDVRSVELDPSGRRVRVQLEDMRPVDQLVLDFELEDARGVELSEEVFLTVHVLPAR